MDLFDALTHAVAGQFWVAILAAGLWGALSIILSPCHLTSIPLILGYISKHHDVSHKQKGFLAFNFALGVLVSIILIGLFTAMLGRIMGDIGLWGNWISGAILILFGIYMLDLIRMSWMTIRLPHFDRVGHLGAALLGLIFGVGLGPCTFAFLAPVLTIVFQLADEAMLQVILMLAAFALGHVGVIVAGANLSSWIFSATRTGNNPLILRAFRRVLGVLLVIGGIYFFAL